MMFTDNDKADPKMYARNDDGLKKTYTTFRGICKDRKKNAEAIKKEWLAKANKEKWFPKTIKETWFAKDYEPCPSDLMAPATCPIEGCDEYKCSIHWTLCNRE